MTHNIPPVSEAAATTPTEAVDDFLLTPREAPARPAFYVSSDLYTVLATTRETDFSFNAFDYFVPVNGGPPAHYHRFEDETWYVTDGKIRFNFDDQADESILLPEGGLAFGPVEKVHQFQNIGSTASVTGVTPGSRTFATTAPGALDLLFNAAGERVTDRNDPVPEAGETPLDLESAAKFGARIDAPISFTELGASPGYEAPEDALDYVVVLPEDAGGKVVKQALALSKVDGFSVWTTGDQAELPKRPTVTGSFGIEYTSLLTKEETGNAFSYDQFSLEPQDPETDADNFPDPVKSEDDKFFYVNEGQLSVKIGDEVRVAEKDTFVYIAPGNEYSIANFGDKTVEAIAATVVDQESPARAGNELFPSPLDPQGSTLPPNEHVFLSNEADFFNGRSAGGFESRRRIYSGKADDELFANKEDRLFGEEGDDILNASTGKGGNQLYGGKGNDEILVNVEDRGFGGEEDDLLDASFGSGHNLLDGGDGDDFLIAGSNDQLAGDSGDDLLNVGQGSNNLFYGGSGADQFRIVNDRLPDAVEVQYPEYISYITPPGVTIPDLVDTKNTIRDFELGVDKIHIRGIKDIVSSFDDLELLPAFGDLESTSIIASFTEDGMEKEISLANVSGVTFNELSANDFVFA